jgi:hypothetical protein
VLLDLEMLQEACPVLAHVAVAEFADLFVGHELAILRFGQGLILLGIGEHVLGDGSSRLKEQELL